MLFKELLRKVNIDDIICYINSNYIDEVIFEDKYRKLYLDLLNIEPDKDLNMILFVVEQKDFTDEEDVFFKEVSGYSLKDNQIYALEFVDRKSWLGMPISCDSLSIYGDVVFVSECLREMTFISFDEQEVEKELNDLTEVVERIKNGTEDLVSEKEVQLSLSDVETEALHLRYLECKKWNDNKIDEVLKYYK